MWWLPRARCSLWSLPTAAHLFTRTQHSIVQSFSSKAIFTFLCKLFLACSGLIDVAANWQAHNKKQGKPKRTETTRQKPLRPIETFLHFGPFAKSRALCVCGICFFSYEEYTYTCASFLRSSHSASIVRWLNVSGGAEVTASAMFSLPCFCLRVCVCAVE